MATQWERQPVARHIYGGHFADWEDYPDVGEEDWLRVIKRIADLGLNMQPGTAKVDQALELLRKRGLSS